MNQRYLDELRYHANIALHSKHRDVSLDARALLSLLNELETLKAKNTHLPHELRTFPNTDNNRSLLVISA